MWEYDWNKKTLVHVNTGLCMTKADSTKDATLPLLKKCNGKRSQRWLFKSNFKWQGPDHEKKTASLDEDSDDV